MNIATQFDDIQAINHPWKQIMNTGQYDLIDPNKWLVHYILTLSKQLKMPYLDLGCGFGRHLLPMLNSQSVSIGLDINIPESLFQLSKTTPGLNLTIGYMHKLPFKNNSVGIVLSWRSLYLQKLKNIKRTISEIKRILAPGGYFIGSVRTTTNTLCKIAASAAVNIEPNTFNFSDNELFGAIYHFFSKDEILNLLSEFRVENFYLKELRHTSYTTAYSYYPNDFWIFIVKK
ncbi:MAG: class I SAM-dependent methyltransferase [Desulfobacteraceae bacterium]|nr:class I SAM-dependent methyltransferase [Desulfobacteraceae bacterium]MBC2756556.1 class I SAM-dependent methyltransferase [Desulfobacteraceae bacterium]